MLGNRKSKRIIGGEEMKKNTLLSVIIISLLIITAASFIVAAFMTGIFNGLIVTGCVSLFYLVLLCAYKDLSKYG